MEITGKIIRILEPLSGVSAKSGDKWVKNTFVLETQGQYPKKLAFGVMGEDKFAQMQITVGGTYSVSFDVESREWQGKWFTECMAWKAVRLDGQQQQGQQTSAQPAPQPQQGGGDTGDLPF